MDVNKAIEVRRSIRKYKQIDIEEDKLDKILESARIAPSAANRQQWKFVVVKDSDTRKKLVDACQWPDVCWRSSCSNSCMFNRI